MTRIAVIGTRGIGVPAGGIERYCEQLYPRLARRGLTPVIFVRPDFLGASRAHSGLECRALALPPCGNIGTLLHAMAGLVVAKCCRVPIIHVHGIGPGLVLPLARLFRMRTVVRHVGRDYARRKWGLLARVALRLGEQAVCRFADHVVCPTVVIFDEFVEATGRRENVSIIPNGAALPGVPTDVPRTPGIGRTFLAVGRFTPEKRFDVLLRAWRAAGMPRDCRLRIVGDAAGSNAHAGLLRALSKGVPGTEVLGPLFPEQISRLFLSSFAAVYPSEHEGMSFSLLEGGVAGCRLVVSDIPSNRATAREHGVYFRTNSEADLVETLRLVAHEHVRSEAQIELQRMQFRAWYDWEAIADSIAVLSMSKNGGPSAWTRETV